VHDKRAFLRDLAGVMSLNPDALSGSEPLRFPEWDSVAVVGALALCDKYGGRVSAADLGRCQTADELFDVVTRTRAAA
jgi:hypothetical protein